MKATTVLLSSPLRREALSFATSSGDDNFAADIQLWLPEYDEGDQETNHKTFFVDSEEEGGRGQGANLDKSNQRGSGGSNRSRQATNRRKKKGVLKCKSHDTTRSPHYYDWAAQATTRKRSSESAIANRGSDAILATSSSSIHGGPLGWFLGKGKKTPGAGDTSYTDKRTTKERFSLETTTSSIKEAGSIHRPSLARGRSRSEGDLANPHSHSFYDWASAPATTATSSSIQGGTLGWFLGKERSSKSSPAGAGTINTDPITTKERFSLATKNSNNHQRAILDRPFLARGRSQSEGDLANPTVAHASHYYNWANATASGATNTKATANSIKNATAWHNGMDSTSSIESHSLESSSVKEQKQLQRQQEQHPYHRRRESDAARMRKAVVCRPLLGRVRSSSDGDLADWAVAAKQQRDGNKSRTNLAGSAWERRRGGESDAARMRTAVVCRPLLGRGRSSSDGDLARSCDWAAAATPKRKNNTKRGQDRAIKSTSDIAAGMDGNNPGLCFLEKRRNGRRRDRQKKGQDIARKRPVLMRRSSSEGDLAGSFSSSPARSSSPSDGGSRRRARFLRQQQNASAIVESPSITKARSRRSGRGNRTIPLPATPSSSRSAVAAVTASDKKDANGIRLSSSAAARENIGFKRLGSSRTRSRCHLGGNNEAQLRAAPGALASASCSAAAAASAAAEAAALAASLIPQVDKGELSRDEMDKINSIVAMATNAASTAALAVQELANRYSSGPTNQVVRVGPKDACEDNTESTAPMDSFSSWDDDLLCQLDARNTKERERAVPRSRLMRRSSSEGDLARHEDAGSRRTPRSSR